ncbi:MAG: U32 family peptidase [Paludibacter sp.]|jgi:putative protease|nr:U32 family peptidase [Paludibacter sp.]
MNSVELLSPAKNLEIGVAAINHGADAVYIGASAFGARAAAGNSASDIEKLAKYASRFRAKIYVTLNTLLYDNELRNAERLIRDVYNAGVDALIIQDLGILEMNLPPIPLHASTQTDNRTAQKVRFLQDVGFSRVVLARELNLQQIKEIRAQTDVELEAFVHGALCVSYSGQCYISQALCGRSANRGQCAQFCRLPYNLLDADENILLRNRHLLSLKDLDNSQHIEAMLDAGVSSFKIEGRLKDADYVKNITAFYRKKIDAVLENKPNYKKASLGKTVFFFEPNPQKTFHRSAIDYFFTERKQGLVQQETPKSLGEKIGKVAVVGKNFITISRHYDTAANIHNGDGFCFINQNNELTGFKVNRVEGQKIFPAEMPDIKNDSLIFRNFDNEFHKILEGKSAERKIGVDIEFLEKNEGFVLKIVSEDGISVYQDIDFQKQKAQSPKTAIENIKTQLAKLGNTIYRADNVKVNLTDAYFFPVAKINEWRREAVEKLEEARIKAEAKVKVEEKAKVIFYRQTLNCFDNVTNSLSKQFYKNCGVASIENGFEIQPQKNLPLMFTKYCIKYELGFCPKQNTKTAKPQEPLYLEHRGRKFRLNFDCGQCEMKVLLLP